jgi:hypothetical protein
VIDWAEGKKPADEDGDIPRFVSFESTFYYDDVLCIRLNLGGEASAPRKTDG